MRSRSVLFVGLIIAVLIVPSVAAAGVPFFGPIIPDAYNRCPGSWGLVVTVVNNIISLLLTLTITFVAPIMIAWAGLLLVTNPANPGNIAKARGILWNTVVGTVIAFAAYLIVAAIMAVLYNPTAVGSTWSDLISSRGVEPCLKPLSALQKLRQTPFGVQGIGSSGEPYLAPVSGDCSVDALVSYGIDPAIASDMSCIAQHESSCNLTAQNPTSSATGLFQIVMGWNDQGHNLNFPECTAAAQAAGYTVSGSLNCSASVLRGGKPNPDKIELYRACVAASTNAVCNAHAAQWLYDNGGYGHWEVAPLCGL